MKPHRFLRNLSFGYLKPQTNLKPLVWSLCSAQNHRGHHTILYLLTCTLRQTVSFVAIKAVALLSFPIVGLQEHLLLCHLVPPAVSGPSPTSIGPCLCREHLSAPSIPLTSFNQLAEPQISGFAHSPQINLRSQGCPSHLLVTPHRWGLGTGYPRGQNKGPTFKNESRRLISQWKRSAI